MWFTVSLLSVFLSGLGFILHVAYKRRRLYAGSWESILAGAESVDIEGLRQAADCYLQPREDQLRTEPNEMWKTVGGLKGLQHLRSNADAMLNLAMFAEQWHLDHGRIVSELMRSDAVRLKKAIFRVELSMLYGLLALRAPVALREAIAIYILMRGRLLGLYGGAHVGGIPFLEVAL